MLFVSLGCPSGVGPEIALAAAAKLRGVPVALVGDVATAQAAAELVGVRPDRLRPWSGDPAARPGLYLVQAGPPLSARDRRPGRPGRKAGVAALAAIERAFDLAREHRGVLITAPASKESIARSGAPGAAGFLGHTEWLQARDGAASSTMCFVAPGLACSLVTTHLPLREVPAAIDAASVATAIVHLAELLRALGHDRPRLAVASLNPHAGEGELLGDEEARAIAPGVGLARRRLRRGAVVEGPIGAETAFRKCRTGTWDGVVAMYHDQATIPMKLVAFGDAVNVTMGLSRPRTSVDHGTAYDIAWRGEASSAGMLSALRLGQRLLAAR